MMKAAIARDTAAEVLKFETGRARAKEIEHSVRVIASAVNPAIH